VSWRIENQLPVVSTTSFGSQLNFSVKRGKVVVSLRPGAYEKIIDSINSSVSEVRKKTPEHFQVTNLTSAKRYLRTKGLRASPETKSIVYQTSNCLPTGCTIVSNLVKKTFERTYTSVRTPGFVSLRKKGQLLPNAYSLDLVNVERGDWNSLKTWTGQPWFVNFTSTASPYLLHTDIPLGHLGVDENLLINKLAGKINPSRANLAEDVAQSHLTVSLMTESFSRFKTFLTLILGGNVPALRVFLGGARRSNAFLTGLVVLRRGGLSGVSLLAALWLEYRYGWLPFLQDIDASVSAFKSYGLKDPGIVSVSASRRKTTNVVRKVLYASNPDGSFRTRYYYEKVATVCRMGVRYKLDSKLIATMSGLGLTSPLALTWELVPFSFVVDWLLPIGPALNAFSAFEGLSFMTGYKTYFTRASVYQKVKEVYVHTDPNPLNSYVLNEFGACYGERVKVNRIRLTAFPGNRIPQLKSPFSFIHAANAAALVTRMLTSGK
jgi:hypothetical protein